MTLRFVATSVMESSDGLNYDKETAIESEDVVKARKQAEQAAHEPLYLQLARLADKKQAEYDANTKAMFAPPKALDEDDIEYFNELEATKNDAMEARAKREAEALAGFRQAARKSRLQEQEQEFESAATSSSSSLPSNSYININLSNNDKDKGSATKMGSLLGGGATVNIVKKRKSISADDKNDKNKKGKVLESDSKAPKDKDRPSGTVSSHNKPEKDTEVKDKDKDKNKD